MSQRRHFEQIYQDLSQKKHDKTLWKETLSHLTFPCSFVRSQCLKILDQLPMDINKEDIFVQCLEDCETKVVHV
jgi:hypothetical protein